MPRRNFIEDLEEFNSLLEEEEGDMWVQEVFIPMYVHNNTLTDSEGINT